MGEEFSVRYNIIEISSMSAFASVKGGLNRGCKDVCFIRIVGVNNSYLRDIENVDKMLTERTGRGQCRYIRINELPQLRCVEDIDYYTQRYTEWETSGQARCSLRIGRDNDRLIKIISASCAKTCSLFKKLTPNTSTTIEKNFVIKLMYWLDNIGEKLFEPWEERRSYKFVYSGKIKKQEYLFCCCLTLLGIDVMLLLPERDLEASLQHIGMSRQVIIGNGKEYIIPEYEPLKFEKIVKNENASSKPDTTRIIPVNSFKQPADQQASGQQPMAKLTTGRRSTERRTAEKRELEFEELAMLASAVVMITIHDTQGEIVGTGSGIMIGKDGYILTNHHVASGGRYYSVRIEDEEEIYRTDEIIKYNSVLDLAVIRIGRSLKPLPVYKGRKKLVRGQKVVAIGSPLGLFNSVSDGIISGFRILDGVDMIQFTAPISHGSSGGAVLNLYGEVIGISTAGIDSGQNINLAVGYECINQFIMGFV